MQPWKKRTAAALLSAVLAAGAAVPAMAAEPNAGEPGSPGAVLQLDIKLIGRYTAPGGETAAEIVVYNKFNQKAYAINGAESSLDILNLARLKSPAQDDSTVTEITYEKRVYLTDIGLAAAENDMTSVAVSPTGDYIALAVPGKYTMNSAITTAKKGKIILLTPDGRLAGTFEAGYLPDMVTFTPDGKKVLAANEGEPTLNYLDDPQGSVTVIDIAQGLDKAVVTQVGFDKLGAEAFDANVRFFPKGQAALTAIDRAKDLEPEYIAVEPDSSYAYVTLQENNAIARLNLRTLTMEHVYGLGYKDYSLPQNKMDVSDKDGKINIANWPVFGMYQPDGMSLFQKNGKTYLVTANEGDTRAYVDESVSPSVTYYNEEVTVKDIASKIKLDRSKYQGYTEEQWNALDLAGMMTDTKKLGGLTVTSSTYTVTGAAYYDALYAFGGRSFSIWDAANLGAGPVYDSGSGFEDVIAAGPFAPYFNMNQTKTKLDGRSTKKGPEPEGAAYGTVGGKQYAFIGLERMSGIMAYDVTNPLQPVFATYSREPVTPNNPGMDIGPEGLSFVPAADSPTGQALLLAGNETSGTVSIYEVKPGAAEQEPFRLRVVHTNDTHSHLESADRRITAIEESKNDHSILLDAGDVFSGTLYFTKFNGLADVEFMNQAGYDAMTFGNHEFDKGPSALRDFLDHADFPLVSSNIDFTKEDALNGLLESAIDGKGQAGHIYKAVTLDVKGEKIGVFGLTTPDTVGLSSPGGNITFQYQAAAAQATVNALKAAGINKIIALTHLGYDEDIKLAEAVKGIDIIVGGHSHTKLDTPTVVGADAEPTLIVQTGEYGQYVGTLDAAFDANGVLLPGQWNGRLLQVDKKVKVKGPDAEHPFVDDYYYVGNTDAKARLTGYNAEIDGIKKQIVGKTDVVLDGVTANVRSKETNLGDLMAEGMLSKMKELVQDSSVKGYVTIQNGGGIRSSIPAGDISLGSVMTVMPFANNLVALKMTGQEINAALENGVSGIPSGGRFPQVAGMRFWYDSTRQAEELDSVTSEVKKEGKRIVKVEVKQPNGSFAAIDPKAYYYVAANSFMAGGGDFYRSMKTAKDAGRMVELYLPDYQVFLEYLDKLGTVHIATDGRITDLKGTALPSEQPPYNPGPAPPDNNGGNSTVTDGKGGLTLQPGTYTETKETTASGSVISNITVKAEELKAALQKAEEKDGKPASIMIKAQEGAQGAVVQLPGAIFNSSWGEPATVVVQSDLGSYELPLQLIPADARKESASVKISLVPVEGDGLAAVQSASLQAGTRLQAGSTVEFRVSVEANGSERELSGFGTTYVSRILALPEGSAAGAYAVMLDSSRNKLVFVPQVRTDIDGRPGIKVMRPGNSIYALVTASKSFGDLSGHYLSGHWAKQDIEWMASRLIVQGRTDSTFAPDQPVTRAEFAALLATSLGLNRDASAAAAFKDVAPSAWYAGDVGAAFRAGLVNGVQDGSYAPEAPITRAEMAVMITRAVAMVKGKVAAADSASTLSAFADRAAVPSWAADSVAYLTEQRLLNGLDGSRIGPGQGATRAESAALLLRALRQLGFAE